MKETNPFQALEEAERIAAQKRPARRWIGSAVRSRYALVVVRIRKLTPAALEKLLFFGGLAAIVWGSWMLYRPLGPLAGGALAVWISMLISMEREP